MFKIDESPFLFYNILVSVYKARKEVTIMSDITKESMKDKIISALIELNVFKMPDGRQLYQVSMTELLEQYEQQKQVI